MGSSASIRLSAASGGLPSAESTLHTDLQYRPNASVQIKQRDETGEVIDKECLVFTLPAPVFALAKLLAWEGRQVCLSACILPGFDPRGLYRKECQDTAFFDWFEDGLLLGVYDGHGRFGKEVVKTVRRYVIAHFRTHAEEWRRDAQRYVFDLTKACDRELVKRSSLIDVRLSGTTQVMTLFYQGKVYTASVGDSRSVIATTRSFTAPLPPERGEDKVVLEGVKTRRTVSVDRLLKALQLSQDQKPEDPVELERIMNMGGVVRKLMDEFGNDVGPWRVWKKSTNGPGLAMSRSLGDTLGKEVGVISDPLVTVHAVQVADDFFIVCASDGVWDVMENQEVADFVEAYRSSCKREANGASAVDYVRPSNSTIAQLICEEARVRWQTIVEEEDVLIDDISCVVLELQDSHLKLALPPYRLAVSNLAMTPLEKGSGSVPKSQVKVRDPRRGSVTEELALNKP